MSLGRSCLALSIVLVISLLGWIQAPAQENHPYGDGGATLRAAPGQNLITQGSGRDNAPMAPTHDCNDPLNPLLNCGFESAFANWVAVDLSGPFHALSVDIAGVSPGFGFFTSAPTEGSFAVLHGFDATTPGTIIVAQDVTLPLETIELLFDYRAAWDLATYGATIDRTFRVDIEPSGGGAALQSTTILVAPAGTDTLDTGNRVGSADLSAFAGQAVRISFEWDVPEPSSGPAFFQLDNVLVRVCNAQLTVNNVCEGTALCVNESFPQYLWSYQGATTQCITPPPGTYTVTVTDVDGCTATGSGTVYPNPIPSVDDVCEGEPLCVNEDFPGASYQWSYAGATTRCITPPPGAYTVTVTDSDGCTGTATADVLEAPSVFAVDVCNGGQLCSTAGGGTPPYAYLWSTGESTSCITPPPGGYTVTVTDATGCTASAVGLVYGPEPVVLPVCLGDTLCVEATSPLSYQWSTGATTQCILEPPGTYTVTVTDIYGCTGTASGSVYLPLARVYVDIDALGANDGSSWTHAFTDLQDGLNAARACGVPEVWVAEGTYRPTPGTDRTISFVLNGSVAVYGGFAGTETQLSQRNFAANPTILSGDIGVSFDNADNSHHVVAVLSPADTPTLDGFMVTDGNADGPGNFDNGGGLYAFGGAPTVRNVRFTDNQAYSGGGALLSRGLLEDVLFDGNIAGNRGGGVYDGGISATYVNVEFRNNQAFAGGGMRVGNNVLIQGSTRMIGALFHNNSAAIGGAIANESAPDDTLQLTNVTSSGNTGGVSYGGGLANYGITHMTGCVFWGDIGPEIINNGGATVLVSHSIVMGSGGSGAWDPTYGNDLGNNLDVDPLFIDELGGDLHLAALSPAVNGGSNVPGLPATDLDGAPRISGYTVDMGAYEYQFLFAIHSILDVANDQGRNVRLTFCAHEEDNPGAVTPILDYAIFRKIDPLPAVAALDAVRGQPLDRAVVEPGFEAREPDESGRSVLLLEPGDTEGAQLIGWDFVGTVPAFGDREYSVVAPTLADSTIAKGMHLSTFLVRARTAVPTTFYQTDPGAGYSLDNLSPMAPQNLSLNAGMLLWDEPSDADFNYFSVYGSNSLELDGAAVLIGTTTGTSADVGSESHPVFHVTATDFSGNEGDAATATSVVGVDVSPRPTFMFGASPNPFRMATRIRYSLPEEGRVELVVFDVRGRRLETLVGGEIQAPGDYELSYRPPAGGVYFLKLQAGDRSSSLKLVLLE